MKKLLVIALLALGSIANAAQGGGQMDSLKPLDDNKNAHDNLDFIGATISSGTRLATARYDTGKQWATGAGVLYDVLIGTGAATEYVVCMDTAQPTGNVNVNPQDPEWIYLTVPTFRNTTNAQHANTGAAGPVGRPVRFEDGLYCISFVPSGNAANWYVPVFRAKNDP